MSGFSVPEMEAGGFVLFTGRHQWPTGRLVPAAVRVPETQGVLYVNVAACRLLQNPTHLVFMVGESSRMVGLKAADGQTEGARPLNKKSKTIAARALIDHCNLQPGLYPVELVEGMLVFSMTPDAQP